GSPLREGAQVLAAAFAGGSATGGLGRLVRLPGVVLRARALLALGLVTTERGTVKWTWKDPPVPWFVIGFLALGIAGSFGLLPAAARQALATASIFLMTAAMAAMGLHTPLAMLRSAGLRVVYAGLLAFAGLAALSFTL